MNTGNIYLSSRTFDTPDWTFILSRVCIFCSVIQIIVALSLLALRA